MLKNRICYIIMIIISFWLMLMYEGAFVEAIFAVIVMIPIFLIIVKYITRRMLSCRWVADTVHVTAGKSVKVTSIIYNGFIVPINRIEMKYEITDLAGNKKRCTMVTNLMYWTERKCTMEICPDYSGIITVKLKSVKIYDFFGLTSTTKKIGSVLNISVMPKTQRLLLDMHQQEKTAVQEGDVYSNIFPGNDKTQIFDVSPYHEGDNIKDIHWKLSLKTEEFVVKKYSMPVCSETNVYVDFAVPEDKKVTAEGVDRFYSYVFSIVESLESSEEKVNLYIFDIEGNLINLQNEGEILMPGQQGCRYAENVLDTFGKCIEKGRNILCLLYTSPSPRDS